MELFAQLVLSGLVVGSTYALLGVSFGVIYATTRIFHFANAATYAVAAYAAMVVGSRLSWPLPIALVVAVAVATAAGTFTEVLLYRPMRERGGTLMTIFLVSLGLNIAVANLIQIVFGPEAIAMPGFPLEVYSAGTVTISNRDVLSVASCWIAIAMVVAFLRYTKYGRAVIAVESNETMALLVGVRPDRIYLLVFAIGSALCGLASGLFMLGGVAQPGMGLGPILMSFIAVFLGGVPSILGAAIGGLLVGLVRTMTGLLVTGDVADIAVFALLFAFLLLRPQGLLGRTG